jgi:glycosyltransferase involved in cell wall biosynthesis
VIDDSTRDDSQTVAEAFTDRVEIHPFVSFPAFRNAAIDLARSAWIFFIDADERVSPALADEARAAVTGRSPTGFDDGETAPVAYWVPRLNIMFNRLVRGGGWYPDEQLRLLRCDSAHYDETQLVHESAEVTGPTGRLTEPLLHLNYHSFHQFTAKQRRYAAMEADTLVYQGIQPRRRALLGAPLREFGHRYFALRGWIDGPVGLFLSLAMAYYAFVRVRLARRATARQV